MDKKTDKIFYMTCENAILPLNERTRNKEKIKEEMK